jgi:membrane protease subunit (stomatin/prohibitin family)
MLVAGAKTFLSPKTGADAQEMHHGSMPGMSGMNEGPQEGMKSMPGMSGAPRNPAEQATAEHEHAHPGSTPTGEQLQSTKASDYTCRMHPEVHSDKPGKCPKCGMTLVTRESLEKANAVKEDNR